MNKQIGLENCPRCDGLNVKESMFMPILAITFIWCWVVTDWAGRSAYNAQPWWVVLVATIASVLVWWNFNKWFTFLYDVKLKCKSCSYTWKQGSTE